jgi:photosynthetic reaction center cytochrome c subunit
MKGFSHMASHQPIRNRIAILATLTLAGAALSIFPAKLRAQAESAAGGQQAAAPKPKTAGEAFKNIQVLKDIRQDELFPSMRYITAALGVRCDFCHVPEHFEKDDKPQKARAREMMKMMFAINNDNFHGHREITCYTCHRGSEHPVGMPAVANASAMGAMAAQMPPGRNTPNPAANSSAGPPPGGGGGERLEHDPGDAAAPSPGAASLPTVDDIIAKYTQALGGADVIQKAGTRVEKGTVDVPERNSHNTMEVFRKAPDKAFAILHTPMGDIVEGYDGVVAWENHQGHGVTEETGDSLNRVKDWASFITGLDLKRDYARVMVSGIEKIGDHDAYRVFASRKEGGMERLYFDTQSGLLLRVDARIDSPLGSLPQETSYEDYRDVSGVKIPFTIRVAKIDSTTIYKWSSVEMNVPVGEDRFAKPADAAPASGPQPGNPKAPTP